MDEQSLGGLENNTMVAHDGSVADGVQAGTTVVQVSNFSLSKITARTFVEAVLIKYLWFDFSFDYLYYLKESR